MCAVEPIGYWTPGSATLFYRIAEAARIRSENRPVIGEPLHNALTALVFAHATIEAHVNETFALASLFAERNELLSRFAAVDEEIFDFLNVGIKYQLARIMMTGVSYDRGQKPFSELIFLVSLRNDLLHPKPLKKKVGVLPDGTVEEKHDKLIDGLVSRGLYTPPTLPEPVPKQVGGWRDCLKSPETEQWACKTAYEMTESLLQVVPKPFDQLLGSIKDGQSVSGA
jgi:hypothetical protein